MAVLRHDKAVRIQQPVVACSQASLLPDMAMTHVRRVFCANDDTKCTFCGIAPVGETAG